MPNLVVHASNQVAWPHGQEGRLCGYGDVHLTTAACDIHDCQLLQTGAIGQAGAPCAADHRYGCQVCVQLPRLQQQQQQHSQVTLAVC